jgi:hypothetical protein
MARAERPEDYNEALRPLAQADRTIDVAQVLTVQEQERLREEVYVVRRQIQTRRAQVESERLKTAKKPEFVAQGLLAPLEGMEKVDYPIKFKLTDQNKHPLVVLKSTAYDLSKYVGRVIGVRGPKTYLQDWKIYLVTVDDLEIIDNGTK